MDRPNIVGIIWTSDNEPLIFTMEEKGSATFKYAEIPTLEEWIRNRSKAEHVALGDEVDTLNDSLGEWEPHLNPYKMSVSWSIGQLDTDKFSELLGIKFK